MEMFDYRFFTERIPFFLFMFYAISKNKDKDIIFKLHIYIIILFMPIFVFLYLYGLNLFDYMHNYWDLEAPIEYGLFMILYYYYSLRKTYEIPFSATISYLLVSMVGYIYEIPRFIKIQGLIGIVRYNKYSLFYLDFQIVSILLIYSMLKEKGFKINYKIVLGVLFYLSYILIQLYSNVYAPEFNITVSWIDYVSYYYLGNWIYRIPSLIMCLSLISGIKEKKEG